MVTMSNRFIFSGKEFYWLYQNKIRPLVNSNSRFCISLLDNYRQLGLLELTKIKDEAFSNLINHAYDNVPYYRNIMDKLSLNPYDFKTIEDIVKLPLLTKNDIRKHSIELRATNISISNRRRSGGTTGEPIETLLNERAHLMEIYANHHGMCSMGVTNKDVMISLFGGSMGIDKNPFKRTLKEFFQNTVFLSAFELNAKNLKNYVKVLRKNKESILIGYASALLNLANLIIFYQYTDIKMKLVISTAEFLSEDWAMKMRTAFNCSVKSYYGCGEVNALGYQTTNNGSYIVPDEHVHIESIDHNLANIPKNSLCITSLYNYAQPLIRYVNGDMGIISKPTIETNNRSIIKELFGRISDCFVKKDGTLLSGSFGPHMIFKMKLPVLKYQIIQKSLTEFEFRYSSKDELDNASILILKSTLSNFLNLNKVDLDVKKTNDFFISDSGKHRIMISNML